VRGQADWLSTFPPPRRPPTPDRNLPIPGNLLPPSSKHLTMATEADPVLQDGRAFSADFRLLQSDTMQSGCYVATTQNDMPALPAC
jgi:hypothetical protein